MASIMEVQSYAKHAKFDSFYHRSLVPFLLIIFIGAMINLFQSFGDHSRLYNAALIAALAVALIWATLLVRSYPLKAQDRAIRAEENLRHFILTGKSLDPRLTIKQIVALRFASDAEFPDLAARATQEILPPDTIKRSVQNWRADYDRL